MQHIPNKIPYLHRVARGLVPGAFYYSVVGQVRHGNDSVSHDIWQYGGDNWGDTDYVFPADGTAPIDRVSSSNAGDTGPVFMTGLDINGDFTEQTAVLDGQNPVTLGTPLWRCMSAFNLDSASSPVIGDGFVGNIHWYNNAVSVTGGVPDTASDTKCFINNGNNKTLQALFTVPNGYCAFLMFSRVALVTRVSANATLDLYFRPYGLKPQLVDSGTIGSTGTSIYSQYAIDPVQIDPLTDFIPRITVDTLNTTVSAVFAFMLIKDRFELYA